MSKNEFNYTVDMIESLFWLLFPNGLAYPIRDKAPREDCFYVNYNGHPLEIDASLEVRTTADLTGAHFCFVKDITSLMSMVLKEHARLMNLQAQVSIAQREIETNALLVG